MAGLRALRLPSVILMYCLPCLDFVALLLHAPTLQARYSWMLLSTMFRFRFCSCMLRCPLCRLNVPRGPNSRLPELPTMQPAPYLSEKSQLGNGVLCTLLEHVAVVKSECESAPATKSGRPLCFERFYALVEELPPVGYSVWWFDVLSVLYRCWKQGSMDMTVADIWQCSWWAVLSIWMRNSASNMTGSCSGIQWGNIPFSCSASLQHLALASRQAADNVLYIKSLMKGISRPHYYSPQPWNRLQHLQIVLYCALKKFQQVFHTKWLYFNGAVHAVLNNLESLNQW